MSKETLAQRDWQSVLEAYQASSPYNYAVMDDFLAAGVCEQLHQELVHHEGWRYHNTTGQVSQARTGNWLGITLINSAVCSWALAPAKVC